MLFWILISFLFFGLSCRVVLAFDRIHKWYLKSNLWHILLCMSCLNFLNCMHEYSLPITVLELMFYQRNMFFFFGVLYVLICYFFILSIVVLALSMHHLTETDSNHWYLLFFMILWQARQSLIVRGLFPLLADPRHPVRTKFVTWETSYAKIGSGFSSPALSLSLSKIKDVLQMEFHWYDEATLEC